MSSREEKVAFVSGLTGTSLAEIYLLTLTLLCGYLLRCCCLVCVPGVSSLASRSPLAGFGVEYCTVILPAILTFTVLADYASHILLAELSVCSLLIIITVSNSSKVVTLKSTLMSNYPSRYPYITVMRTFVNLFTAIAILGVDFTIYPRRLAKSETYGSGMMDVGVGAFLMAHGVTSPEARDSRTLDSSSGRKGRGYLRLVYVTVRQVLPLLAVGIIRLLSVKATDYQEHVSEYGVHWNFFFTIATVRVRM
jgi:phosphatidylinositol glycan class W